MDAVATPDISLFADFRLDRRGGALYRRGEQGVFAPLAIGRRAVDILGVLIERPGELVLRDEIIEVVWHGRAVEDSNLNVQIAALRRILDRDREQDSCIQTIPGRGYRFVAAVVQDETTARSIIETLEQRSMHTPPRLSIVVLPFVNLSNDPEQQYFADGVTEDLTTDLSRLPGMLVISRNTAFTYKGKPTNAKQIGRELSVCYVLEGSVQRSPSLVRMTAQLIDAETDVHLWAERFEGDATDLFALQHEITSRIAIALNLALVGIEAARPNANPGVLDYIFRARAAQDKPASREKYAEAIRLFEQALALDPQSVEAQSRLAIQLTARVLDRMTDTVAADTARAEELVEKALELSPRTYISHFAKGQLLRRQRRCAEAITEYETVLAYNRNAGSARAHIARCKMFLGLMEDVIPLLEQQIRLSPRDPDIYAFYELLGRAHLLQSRADEAIVWLEKSRSAADPAYPFIHAWLAAAYGFKGETDDAAAELAEARKLGGEGFVQSIARLRTDTGYETPSARALVEATYYTGLRKAGVPEE